MPEASPDPAIQAAPPPPWDGAMLRRSPAAKVGMILGLLLVMQIPLLMVGSLITEREARQADVLAGFRRGWGAEQTVAGPMLMVPFTAPNKPAQASDGAGRWHGWAFLPAARLHVVANLQPETRRRGLFHAIVYRAGVDLSGSVTIPPLHLDSAPDAVADWAAAQVMIGASDLRGMPADARIDWNGSTAPLTIADSSRCGFAILAAPANLQGEPAPGTSIAFKASLALRGTQAFRVLPAGRQIDVRVTSSWPTPSFTGATLPLHHELKPDGFDAQWEVADAATRDGWQLDCAAVPGAMSADSDAQIGVELQEAVPTYVLVDRAAKYGVFFLALSYLTLFLFEILSGVRIHLIQYGMVGLSVSLFALLLVSVAEPVGFTIAYAISAAAVVAQASLYTLAVVRRHRLAAVFAGVLGSLFGFLYVVLNLDTYALLAGTLALFVALSVLMLVTRRVNWAAEPAGS